MTVYVVQAGDSTPHEKYYNFILRAKILCVLSPHNYLFHKIQGWEVEQQWKNKILAMNSAVSFQERGTSSEEKYTNTQKDRKWSPMHMPRTDQLRIAHFSSTQTTVCSFKEFIGNLIQENKCHLLFSRYRY